MRTPSLADFGTHQDSSYPELWDGCVHAYCPSLGITGDRIFDFSGRNRIGTFANLTASSWSLAAGKPQLDFSFTGATNVSLGTFSPLVYDKVTVAAWVYRTEDRSDVKVFASGTTLGYFLGTYAATGRMQGQFTSSAIARDASSTVTLNEWFHVVFTYSDDIPRLYVNGDLRATGTSTTATISTAALAHRIGSSSSGTSQYWPGSIDDIRVYNRELSISEIRQLGGFRGIAYTRARKPSTFFVSLAAVEAITGSGSSSTGDAFSSCSALVGVSGVSSRATGNCSALSVGLVEVRAVGSAITSGVTGSAQGVLSVVGSASVVAADVVSVASGVFGVAGLSAVQLDGAASQCIAVQVIEGNGSSSTSCQSSSGGIVGIVGSSSAVVGDAESLASGFNGIQGAGAAPTDAVSSASGLVSLVGLAVVTTADAVASASGQIPLQGSVAVQLGLAFSVAVGAVLQTDVELAGVVKVGQCDGKLSSPWLVGRVRKDKLEGRKIWP